MSHDDTTIPSRLDDPPKFLWWDYDVAMLFILFFLFGLMTGWFLAFTVCGLFLAALYRRAKYGQHRAYALHLLYWHLPIRMGMRATPPSAIRELIG